MRTPNGKLNLTFRKNRSGKTYISKQFYELPMQIARPYYQDDDGTAFLATLNMSGGIFGKDYLRMEVKLEENSSVLLTNLSATKVYRAHPGDSSLVENEVTVGENAAFEYFPDCLIPFADSDLRQINTFRLKKSSFLMAVDFVTSGRTDLGEEHSFRRYGSDLSIFIEDRLVVRERMELRQDEVEMNAMGILESHKNYASVYVYSRKADEALVRQLKQILANKKDVYAGCTMIEDGLIVVKLLGDSTYSINMVIEEIWDALRRALLGKGKVSLRKL